MSKDKKRFEPGTILDGRFEILDVLGAGNFGAVYKARQRIFGHPFRVVALKVFEAALVTPENASDVFSDAVLLACLQDAGAPAEVSRRMIQLYDIGVLATTPPQAFMSLKLVPGKRTLDSVVTRFQHIGGTPVLKALDYVRQLLIPLAWMHTLDIPIVHGDLKPDNVLLDNDDTVVLTDFGLAAHVATGSLGGAVAYMAPEVLLGLPANLPADIYDVGLIFYELLTGKHPFSHVGRELDSVAEQATYMKLHKESRKWEIRPARRYEDYDRIIPASELNTDMRNHPQLEILLARCLAYNASDRYANAKLLLSDVESYLKAGSLNSAIKAPVATPQTPVSRAPDKEPTKDSATRQKDAEALWAQGKREAALSLLDAILKNGPVVRSAERQKARYLAELGKFQDAELVLNEAIKRDNPTREVLETLADVRERAGKLAGAANLRVQARSAPSKP